MKGSLVKLCLGLTVSTALVIDPGDSSAGDPKTLSVDAKRSGGSDSGPPSAEGVLQAELKGDLQQRNEIVAALAKSEKLNPLAQSLLGRILDGRRGWVDVDEVVARTQASKALDRYEAERASQTDSVEGHLYMAQWCRRNRLEDQARAHLSAVLAVEPDHAAVRGMLGHQRVDGRWLSQTEIQREIESQQRWASSMRRYGSKVARLAKQLLDENPRVVDVARDQLFAIEDPDAIPAVESVFTNLPVDASGIACDWLGKQADPDASLTLARWSVLASDTLTREAAQQVLRDKPRYTYVPYLLDCARSQVIVSSTPVFRADGTLSGVRHMRAQERRNTIDVQVEDALQQDVFVPAERVSQRLADTAGRPREDRTPTEDFLSLSRDVTELNDLNEQIMRLRETEFGLQLQLAAAFENVQIEQLNARIAETLASAADAPPASSVNQLWDWWATYSEREPPSTKLVSTRYGTRLTEGERYAAIINSAVGRGGECFVAGTPVRTKRGMKAIEELVVGDQVLSRDLESGELAWDIVVQTTEQPAKEILEIKTDGDRVLSTGGHLFWVSGKGWTKARELLPCDVLHTVGQPMVVELVQIRDPQPTYNLVTELHHNYFVGETGVLSHDFVEPRAVSEKVPGLASQANE